MVAIWIMEKNKSIKTSEYATVEIVAFSALVGEYVKRPGTEQLQLDDNYEGCDYGNEQAKDNEDDEEMMDDEEEQVIAPQVANKCDMQGIDDNEEANIEDYWMEDNIDNETGIVQNIDDEAEPNRNMNKIISSKA